jgi:UDP-2-acetamido-3-amino-2,3-dideoxy-glucuronate N-acetyltransferase
LRAIFRFTHNRQLSEWRAGHEIERQHKGEEAGRMTPHASVRIHPTAEVSDRAEIGPGTSIWNQCQVRELAQIGSGCILSKDVYVDAGVQIGNYVKVQNGVSIYHGVTLEDGVFCGPHCVFTNDRQPRAVNPDGTLKQGDDWLLSETRVCAGASIGAGAVIVCGVTVGRWAMIGAGAVVTRDVPNYGLVYGNPARLRGFVCPCGQKLAPEPEAGGAQPEAGPVWLACPKCQTRIAIPQPEYARLAQRVRPNVKEAM